MLGYYIVSSNSANEKYDIRCELHPERAKDEVPDEQQKLYIEVENTNNIIKSLINSEDIIKEKYFQKLLSLAQAGLVGETAQPNLALKSLIKLKEEMILIEGQRIKNSYMRKLGLFALGISICLIIIDYIIASLTNTSHIRMYIITCIGAMLGSWVSFGARKYSISFEQLSLLEDDMMGACIRLFYVGACSIIFVLFLNSGIINITIGKMSTDNMSNSLELQATVGVLCGLIESKLGINIYEKAQSIIY